MPANPAKSSLHQQCIDIINHFIKEQVLEAKDILYDKYFWPREIYMAKSLIKKYKYENLVFLDLGFKVNSLLYFKGYEGIKKLNEAVNLRNDMVNMV